MQERPLRNKRVLITGASRGLGACIAQAMWHEGATLLLVARSEKALLDLRAELMASARDGQRAHVLVADLSVLEAVVTIIGEARRLWERIDVLVNNAAILYDT